MADARPPQELAGHENLTTLRYMRLSPAARKSAIALLNERVEEGGDGDDFGEMLETGPKPTLGTA